MSCNSIRDLLVDNNFRDKVRLKFPHIILMQCNIIGSGKGVGSQSASDNKRKSKGSTVEDGAARAREKFAF